MPLEGFDSFITRTPIDPFVTLPQDPISTSFTFLRSACCRVES